MADYWAPEKIKYYLDNPEEFHVRVGQKGYSIIDGEVYEGVVVAEGKDTYNRNYHTNEYFGIAKFNVNGVEGYGYVSYWEDYPTLNLLNFYKDRESAEAALKAKTTR